MQHDALCPVVEDSFALRRVGSETCYLVNSKSGDYYELEEPQLEALRLADGVLNPAEIAKRIDVPAGDVSGFFEEQAKDGVVGLGLRLAAPKPPHYRACPAPHLSDVLVEVTGRCNLRCAHCFNSGLNTAEAISQEMSTQQLLALVGELDDLNVRRIQLSGGEALLRDDLWEIIEALETHRIFLDVISTNGTLVAEQDAGRFAKRFRDHGALYVSMDGLTADTYEVIRGPSTFDRFMRSMNALLADRCRVFVNTMAIRTNLHEMDAMYDWLAAQPSIKGWRIGMPKVLGRYLDHHKELEVEFDEVIKVFKHLLGRWLVDRPPFRLELSDFFRTDSLETGLEDHRAADSPCKYAMSNMSIKPDGTAIFCASLEIHEPAVLGNVASEGLAGVWYGQRHMNFRKKQIADLPTCKGCRYARICGGGCRSNALLSFDDIDAADPRACTAMQILEEEILPLLPPDYTELARSLVHKDVPFVAPTGFRRFI